MKLTGGKFNGFSLYSPKSTKTRPSSASLRKALFDSIQFEIENSNCLDLFAGCGTLGLEALSRGAHHVFFIDDNREALFILKKNIEKLGVQEMTQVIKGSLPKAIERIRESFDLIFIDPPYALCEKLLPPLLEEIGSRKLLNDDGKLFLEMGKGKVVFPSSFILQKEKHFGETTLYILTRAPVEA